MIHPGETASSAAKEGKARGSRRRVLAAALKVLFWATGVGLSIIPPLLVVLERWHYLAVRDILRHYWCRVPLLCRSVLPSYFLWIIPAFGIFILLFLAAARRRSAEFSSAPGEADTRPAELPSAGQRGLALGLIGLSALTAPSSALLAAVSGRLPGVELALAAAAFLFGCWLYQCRPSAALSVLKRSAPRVIAMGFGQLILILFLRSAAHGEAVVWLYGLLLAAALAVLLRFRLAPPVYHVVCASLLLLTYRIGHWQFSVIGDEYSFYSYAVQRLNHNSLDQNLSLMFDGLAVYGSHPFFSSLLQMASMALLGEDNFGWRFSSIYLAAASLFCFHAFFRTFLSKRIALLAVIFLGAAQYLMTFGKIGYNNLQALFALGLLLWAGGRALRLGPMAAYAGLGASMGLCFYLYPAAIYAVPLAWLFLLVFDPPVNRRALRRWGLALAGLALLFIPLLFQPEYWQVKIPGTFLNPAGVIRRAPLPEHLLTNFTYALFSYVYAPDETHYVVSSFIDPLSAALLPAGLAWTLLQVRRSRFALFWSLGFFYMLFAVGATHDRLTPSVTRMFMLLPWFCLYAAAGLAWLAAELRGPPARAAHWRASLAAGLSALLILAMIALNLYMAYSLSRQRTIGVPSLEVLFLRLLQREEQLRPDARLTYFFITEENWGIDGLRVQRDVYNLPRSQEQLMRTVIDAPALPLESIGILASEDTLVILQPWMKEELRLPIETQVSILNKQRCDIRDAPETDIRFTLWLNEKWWYLCPRDGNWALPVH